MIEKKSMLCPNCRRLISNDEPVCPYCGVARPGAPWKRAFAGMISLRRFDPVMTIIAVNAAFYLFSLLLNPSALGLSANPLTFLSPSDGSLFLLGATGTLPIAYGRWWTLISAAFLHGGILHIFFNMMALRQLAPFVLDAFGLHRFAILYVWTGVAGFFVSYLAGVPFTIGASAPVCGLIGAILYYGKSRGGFYGEAIYRQAMGWVVGLVLFGLFIPGINNWAHGGGIISGLLLAFITGYHERRRETSIHRIIGTGSIVIAAAALLWAVIQAIYHTAVL
ncbi:MAG: rhomboid family intramembrane serine protease [Syntrophobacterales bacterium CG03_land_8_20_14_0_80_58_14]|nr:MAG: rhomboid family intramembrane serine protease [Syntrophobacterales bacterium CG03_land_8_20_14_0_80_58_14]